jgi:cytochrome c2
MMRLTSSRLVLFAAALAALLGAACGTIATPEWAAEAQETRVAQAATDEHLTAIAPTHTPTRTPVPPTATNTRLPTATIMPTNTEVLPTATATATSLPPTEAATEEAVASGDPQRGQLVFNTPHTLPDGIQWACAACHSVAPEGTILIGPGLWNVSVHGVGHQHDQELSPEAYIRNSIINPQDVIAPHPQGAQWPLAMPQGFGEVLTEQEIDDLVAYVMTLHD